MGDSKKRKPSYRIKVLICDRDGDKAYIAKHGWIKKCTPSQSNNQYYLLQRPDYAELLPGKLSNYITLDIKRVPYIRTGSIVQRMINSFNNQISNYFRSSSIPSSHNRACHDQAACSFKLIIDKELVDIDIRYTTNSIYDDHIRFNSPRKFCGKWETNLREVSCFKCGLILQEIMHFNYKDLFRICPICLERLGAEASSRISLMDSKLVEDIRQLQIVHKISGGL